MALTVSITDPAGNSAAITVVSGINIDKTKLTLILATPFPAPNAAVSVPFTTAGRPSSVATTSPNASMRVLSIQYAATVTTPGVLIDTKDCAIADVFCKNLTEASAAAGTIATKKAATARYVSATATDVVGNVGTASAGTSCHGRW